MDSRWKKEEIMSTGRPLLLWGDAQGGSTYPAITNFLGWTLPVTAQASTTMAG